MSKTIKTRAQLPAEPGCLAAPVVLGALILFLVLMYWAAFEGATIYGADAEDVDAAGQLFRASWCCLGGAVLLAAAFWGKESDRLVAAAAVALAGAAVLCGTATAISGTVVLGFLCVLLGLLTPWWLLGARYRIFMLVMFSVASALLLWQWWNIVDTSEWLCQPVPVSVETKIRAAMKDPNNEFVAMRATSTATVPGRWIITGDVQDRRNYQGNPNVGFWLLIENDRPPDGQISDSDTIYAINALADERTDFVLASVYKAEAPSDRDAFRPAQDCLIRSLNDKADGASVPPLSFRAFARSTSARSVVHRRAANRFLDTGCSPTWNVLKTDHWKMATIRSWRRPSRS